ncbi:RNA-binding (RRM/RBD/RNP motifs) family protein [Rhynchospora pubera]|uniref:RNA-binding (RRM/RBD/RNP motifs) family protein n=1 Tax=Rhynchospora pubera TaxID=906938 RepID=A0AAV8CAT1_9POAL|nr:RNA-binding (RRM/RBD/RNP motifs) family protein [Rhynchospora pubera]
MNSIIQNKPQTRVIMGFMDLTVQVINISPKATKEDLRTLFSYCGTVHEIKLEWDSDETQMAWVTFQQPYAFQMALLLNNAILIDRRVRILPLEMREIPICSSQSEDLLNQRTGRESYPSASPFSRLLQTEVETIAKAKDLMLDTGRILTLQTGSAIARAEKMAGEIGSNIVNSEGFSKGAVWLSGVLDKASKSLAEFGNNTKRP